MNEQLEAIINESEQNIRIASACVVFASVLVSALVVLSALH